jgi:hypothetical protein
MTIQTYTNTQENSDIVGNTITPPPIRGDSTRLTPTPPPIRGDSTRLTPTPPPMRGDSTRLTPTPPPIRGDSTMPLSIPRILKHPVAGGLAFFSPVPDTQNCDSQSQSNHVVVPAYDGNLRLVMGLLAGSAIVLALLMYTLYSCTRKKEGERDNHGQEGEREKKMERYDLAQGERAQNIRLRKS